MPTLKCSLGVVLPLVRQLQARATILKPKVRATLMKTFTDNEGQIWTLSLSLQKTRKMREALGLDLFNPQHYLQILNSLTDRLAFVFLLCEQSAKEIDVNADQFEMRLYDKPGKEGISQRASLSFLEETEAFFLLLGQKAMAALARKSIESMKAGQAKVDEMMATGQFDSLLDQAQNEVEAMLQTNVGSGSAN